MTAILEAKLSIASDNASLVRLCHIGEDYIDHIHKNTVFLGCPRVLHDC